MATDITTITKLINDFKAETREEAITVQVLGALLQKIADLIGTTARQADLSDLIALRNVCNSIGTVITNITLGNDATDLVYLTLVKGNASTGAIEKLPNAIAIRRATTNHAGVMTAQQVKTLELCLDTTSSLQMKLGALQYNFDTALAMKQSNIIHIECHIIGSMLYIRGASQLIQSGLKPVIFRYTRRSSRYGRNEEGYRPKMPLRRGWHRFYDSKKIKVNNDDSISFRDDSPEAEFEGITRYDVSPQKLFRYEQVELGDKEEVTDVKVPYGKDLFTVLWQPKKFKFAIAFYKETPENSEDPKNKPFNYNAIRTNLAIFRVYVEAEATNDEKQRTYYRLSR